MAGERWRWKSGGALEQIPRAEVARSERAGRRDRASVPAVRPASIAGVDEEDDLEADQGPYMPASLGLALLVPLIVLVLPVLAAPFLDRIEASDVLANLGMLSPFVLAAVLSSSRTDSASRSAERIPREEEALLGVTHLPSKGLVTTEPEEGTVDLPSAIQVTAVGVDQLAGECPYCGDAFESQQEFWACPECGVPHHEDCWVAGEGCTTYGCPGERRRQE